MPEGSRTAQETSQLIKNEEFFMSGIQLSALSDCSSFGFFISFDEHSKTVLRSVHEKWLSELVTYPVTSAELKSRKLVFRELGMLSYHLLQTRLTLNVQRYDDTIECNPFVKKAILEHTLDFIVLYFVAKLIVAVKGEFEGLASNTVRPAVMDIRHFFGVLENIWEDPFFAIEAVQILAGIEPQDRANLLTR